MASAFFLRRWQELSALLLASSASRKTASKLNSSAFKSSTAAACSLARAQAAAPASGPTALGHARGPQAGHSTAASSRRRACSRAASESDRGPCILDWGVCLFITGSIKKKIGHSISPLLKSGSRGQSSVEAGWKA